MTAYGWRSASASCTLRPEGRRRVCDSNRGAWSFALVASGARRTNSARDHEESLAAGGQVSSQEEEAAGRHGTGQTAWVKGGRDDQGFPFSVSVTVSVTV